jgi:hypothetical protein
MSQWSGIDGGISEGEFVQTGNGATLVVGGPGWTILSDIQDTTNYPSGVNPTLALPTNTWLDGSSLPT